MKATREARKDWIVLRKIGEDHFCGAEGGP